jgi:drug/metabolite transporter (DMT)-like permease
VHEHDAKLHPGHRRTTVHRVTAAELKGDTAELSRQSGPRPVRTSTTPEGHPQPPPWLPGVALALVIVLWGLGPPVSKLISAPPLVTVTIRFWISVPILLAMTYATGGRITAEVLKRTWLAGALFGTNLAFVFASLHHASIAVVSVISALQPGVVVVFGRLLGERPNRWHLLWTIVGIGGAAVVVLGAGGKVHTSLAGVLLATAAMLTFTGYFILVRHARSTSSITAFEWMTGAIIFSAITITPVAVAFSARSDWGRLTGADWLYLLFVTAAVGVAGHVIMSWVTRFIQASRSSLYLLGMNVVAVAAAWPIHDEPLTLMQGLGGLVVLGAVGAVLGRSPRVGTAARSVR